MDYCYQCRRHLNGAWACAGCGTPAEELRQRAPVPPVSHHDRHPGQDGIGIEDHQEFGDVPEGEGELVGHHRAPDPTPRRGGQRRARGKRGRRILIGMLLTVVLAAGALSVSQWVMNDQGKGDATAVKEDTSPDADAVAEADAASEPRDSGRPTDPDDPGPAATPGPPPSGSPGPSGAADPGETPSPGASAPDSGAPVGGTTGQARPGSPHHPGKSPSGSKGPSESPEGPPSSGPASASPSPEPKPSETKGCTQILWWCT
jgi:hypothetical protein